MSAMWGRRRRPAARRALLAGLAAAWLLSACSATTPDPTPYPTPAPRPEVDEARAAVEAFLGAWASRDYAGMHRMVAAVDRERFGLRRLRGLLTEFDEMASVHRLRTSIGSAFRITLPPQPRPPDEPPPTPTPSPTVDPSAGSTRTPASPVAAPPSTPTPPPPGTPLEGPVPALAVPVGLHFSTGRFGEVDLRRQLVLVEGGDGWQVRWSPRLLFPELGEDGVLEVSRQAPPRGRIVGQDGTVYAITREDGARVYPQEWLAGQTIGYVSQAGEDDLRSLEREGVRAGDLLGRSGLELGADGLLRGQVGFRLTAVPADGDPVVVLERPMVPGAEVVVTLRRSIQASAQAQIAGYSEAGTAVIDPRTGDVWALASAPLFNPNAMTLGTTLAGQPLAAPAAGQIANHATDGTYPTGSSFKVFTLAAALQTGVAGPQTRMTCNGTWTFSGFTFRNYLEHRLPGTVDLLQAMAFSCNTTYMPLSIMVYEEDQRALTELVRDFGFGQLSGMRYLPHARGQLPDHRHYEETPRWHGATSPFGPFDQIQLSIGQGEFLGSPLQLANAYGAIGNGGRLWVPRIVADARLPDGRVIERVDRQVRRTIPLAPAQLAYVVDSMQAVVDYPYGTAYPAFRGFGIPVAGKSGTAETGGPNPNAWFPAIAPADDPEISVATVLVRVPLATGGSDAAPLVRRVMAQYFAER